MAQKKNKGLVHLPEQISPEALPEWVNNLFEFQGSARLKCEKLLRKFSEEHPELLYPFFDQLVRLLDDENSFIKWGAIITLSNLAAIDVDNKMDRIFEQYFQPIMGPSMITAGNIIGSAWKIAQAKPYLTERIVKELLRVQQAQYQAKGEDSPECRNIACGHAIVSFDHFMDQIEDKRAVLAFVEGQLQNSRAAVRHKAVQFLKKHHTVFKEFGYKGQHEKELH
ncbi:MAG: hypothetical protein EHM72_11840 [Calditrichaeota bacterium]|nr:MAG: hypothetical protein EHM72_11840 [Calditrichota bacterium]